MPKVNTRVEKLVILVVDDEAPIRNFIRYILKPPVIPC